MTDITALQNWRKHSANHSRLPSPLSFWYYTGVRTASPVSRKFLPALPHFAPDTWSYKIQSPAPGPQSRKACMLPKSRSAPHGPLCILFLFRSPASFQKIPWILLPVSCDTSNSHQQDGSCLKPGMLYPPRLHLQIYCPECRALWPENTQWFPLSAWYFPRNLIFRLLLWFPFPAQLFSGRHWQEACFLLLIFSDPQPCRNPAMIATVSQFPRQSPAPQVPGRIPYWSPYSDIFESAPPLQAQTQDNQMPSFLSALELSCIFRESGLSPRIHQTPQGLPDKSVWSICPYNLRSGDLWRGSGP